MLKWHKDFFIGPGVRDINRIQKKLEKRKPVPGIYLLTYPSNPENILDIIPAVTLIQEAPFRLCPEIIGVARGKDEALEVFQEIAKNVYEETGDFKIEEYWRNR